jgi:F-type H+-transporting ATPase subunit epsilon
MNKKTFLKIITPNGFFYNKEVDIVTVKTTEGFIGLMKNKSPFVAALDISNLLINKKNSKDFLECAIAGGIVKATPNNVEIITDEIEEKSKISESRARKSKLEAEKLLKIKKDVAEIHMVEISLKKAINRLSVKSGKE